MRIVMAPADHTGCGYYRMRLPAKWLRDEHDIQIVDDLRVLPLILENGKLTGKCRPHRPVDVVWLQRVVSAKLLEYVLAYRAATGAAIVHEQDDNFHAIPASNPSSKFYGTGKPMTVIHEQTLAAADLCIMSTSDLVDAYARKSQRAAVAHNAIDDELVLEPDRWEPRRTRTCVPGQIRIGWAGSDTHRADLALLARPMRRLFATYPEVRLILAGADLRASFPEDLRARIDYVGSTYVTSRLSSLTPEAELPSVRYFDLLRRMNVDIALAPIESTTFNRGKSYLKILEYGALALPVVASKFGPYRAFKNEVMLCADEREWSEGMSWMVRDCVARDTFARALNVRVWESHRMSLGIREWRDALALLRQSAPAA